MNTWHDDDSDEEYEDEYENNETPPNGVNDEFRKKVISLKHSLYDNTVLKPEIGSEKVHSGEVLQDYLNNINKVYILSVGAQSGQIDKNHSYLQSFPENVRNNIKETLEWISDFFGKNTIPDTIPYTDYIRKSFKEYQFVQDNSFE